MTITQHTRVSLASLLAVLALSGCGLAGADDEDKTISIIVTESAPYQEPTEIAKELLAEDGWTLEPTYVTASMVSLTS